MDGTSFSDHVIPPPALTVQELEQELQFQAVLLQSIDETVADREEAEREVKTEIKRLRSQLQMLKGGPSHNSWTADRTMVRNPSSAMGSDPFARPSTGYGSDPFDTRPNSSTASTPNSGDSLADLPISPSKLELPSRSRKRTHSNVDGNRLVSWDNKSRRTSPSRFSTRPATPSTASGDDDMTAYNSDFVERQKQEEQRIRREKLDAEFALSMSRGFAPSNASASTFASNSTPANTQPSAFDRISGIRPQPTNLGVSSARKAVPSFAESARLTNGRSPPAISRVKSEGSGSSSMGFSSYASHNGTSFGHGVKSQASSARPMPGSYRDDASVSDDSEIEVIASSAFQDNGRYNSSLPGSSSLNANQANLQRPGQHSEARPNSALQKALWGNDPVPNWMSTPSYQPNAGSSYSNSQHGYANNPAPGYMPGAYATAPSNSLAYPSQVLGNGGIGFSNQNGLYSNTLSPYGLSYGPGLGYQINDIPGPGMGNGINMGVPGRSTLDEILSHTNNQNYDDLSNYLNLDRAQHGQLDYIMSDPRKTHQEIKDLLENIRPDSDLPAEDREGTPDGLKYPLYEHQKLALTWMKSMEEGTNKGGILADDMGLGKTISTLALILSRSSTDRKRKTTLIIGPVALIRQWVREIQTKINASHRLSVHMMHGQSKKMTWDELQTYDVVLTTYGTLAAEFGRWEKYLLKLKGEENGEVDAIACKKLFPLLGPKSLWFRTILDEAQCIKNKLTKNAKAACHLKSITRFCLTGTPMMNGVGELYSLIHFLRIKPYNEDKRFQQDFGKLSKGRADKRDTENAMKKLQAVLKAILLRRTKTSLIDGKPIITLPPKTEEIQHVVFSEDEQGFYSALEQKTQVQFNKYMAAGTVMKNYANVLVLLLRLRQCCCHPHLIQDFDKASSAGGEVSADQMIELAKTLKPDVINRLMAAEAFECPVCYDAIENPSIVIPCGHDTCSECLAKISDTADQNNIANGEEGPSTKCPTCRGKVEMNKIIDYATFKKVHMPGPDDIDDKAASQSSDEDDDSDTESDSDTDSEGDADEAGNLKNFVVRDDEEDDAEDEEDDDDQASGESEKKVKSKKQKKKEKSRRRKGKGKAKDRSTHKSLAMLKKEASRSAAGRKKYMKALSKNWETSAKVEKCVELLQKFHAEGEKTIIFSQFVSLLDLVSVPIAREGWRCERYDGGMTPNARNQACNTFTDKPDCKIMLISLKAGNAGLNLVAASRVIILDPFWNPYIEMQAVDRAYRIGQQRSVEVHRILIQNTVEDRIIELQERKKELINAALDEGAQGSIGRLDSRQLAFLFGVGPM